MIRRLVELGGPECQEGRVRKKGRNLEGYAPEGSCLLYGGGLRAQIRGRKVRKLLN